MEIEDVKAFATRLPSDDGSGVGTLPESRLFLATKNGCVYSKDFETVFVLVTADTGIRGWGEVQAPIGGHGVVYLIKEVLRPLLLGQDPLNRRGAWDRMLRAVRTRGHTNGLLADAIAGCDIALWDLAGHALHAPVAALAGGGRRTVPVYVSGLDGSSREQRVEFVSRCQATGFNRFKLVGGEGVRDDLDEAAAIREAAGDSAELYLDAHWCYTAKDAIVLGRGLEALGFRFLEAPVPTELIDAQVTVADKLSIPVAIGEEYRSVQQYLQLFRRGAVDVLQPDVGRCGLTGAFDIAAMARAYGVPIAPHVGVGMGVYVAAALHFAASLPELLVLEGRPLERMERINRILVGEGLVAKGGDLYLPPGEGLGVDVDEDVLLEMTV